MKLWLKGTLFTLSLCAAVPSAQANFAQLFWQGKKPAEIVGLCKKKQKPDQLRLTYVDANLVGQKIKSNKGLTLENYHPSFPFNHASKSLLKRRDWVEIDGQVKGGEIVTGKVMVPDRSIKEDNLVTTAIYAPGYRIPAGSKSCVSASSLSNAHSQLTEDQIFYASGCRPPCLYNSTNEATVPTIYASGYRQPSIINKEMLNSFY